MAQQRVLLCNKHPKESTLAADPPVTAAAWSPPPCLPPSPLTYAHQASLSIVPQQAALAAVVAVAAAAVAAEAWHLPSDQGGACG
jgi:hypothetical protein